MFNYTTQLILIVYITVYLDLPMYLFTVYYQHRPTFKVNFITKVVSF